MAASSSPDQDWLAAAFGLAVSGTMAVTSLALYRVARIRFGGG